MPSLLAHQQGEEMASHSASRATTVIPMINYVRVDREMGMETVFVCVCVRVCMHVWDIER